MMNTGPVDKQPHRQQAHSSTHHSVLGPNSRLTGLLPHPPVSSPPVSST